MEYMINKNSNFNRGTMGRRNKDRRTLSLSDDVNEFLDTLAKTNDASATVDKAVRALPAFKKYMKEKQDTKRNMEK